MASWQRLTDGYILHICKQSKRRRCVVTMVTIYTYAMGIYAHCTPNIAYICIRIDVLDMRPGKPIRSVHGNTQCLFCLLRSDCNIVDCKYYVCSTLFYVLSREYEIFIDFCGCLLFKTQIECVVCLFQSYITLLSC